MVTICSFTPCVIRHKLSQFMIAVEEVKKINQNGGYTVERFTCCKLKAGLTNYSHVHDTLIRYLDIGSSY